MEFRIVSGVVIDRAIPPRPLPGLRCVPGLPCFVWQWHCRAWARVFESGPGGQDLPAGTWQRLEALPDPRSPRGRIYPLACLIAIAVCAFTAAGNDRFTAVGQWIKRAS